MLMFQDRERPVLMDTTRMIPYIDETIKDAIELSKYVPNDGF